MKFSAAVFASIVSVASARLTLSSGAVNDSLNHGDSFDARIILGGLQHEVSKDDLETTGASVVAAYNDVFNDNGFAIDGFHTQSTIAVDSMLWNTAGVDLVVGTTWKCRVWHKRRCNQTIIVDDDAAMLDSTTTTTAAHSELIFVGVDWSRAAMLLRFKPN
jgi:hypothetical protein